MPTWEEDHPYGDALAERQRQNREALAAQEAAKQAALAKADDDRRRAAGMNSRGGSGLLMDKGSGRIGDQGGAAGQAIFGYGGTAGAGAEDAARFDAQAAAADARAAPGMNWGAFQGNLDDSQAMRGEESYGLGLLRDAMDTGRASAGSSAILQGARDNYGSQMAVAGGAGGGALGRLAARRGAEVTGNALGLQAGTQAQALRAMEAAQARAQYGQAAGAMRAGDTSYGNASLAQQEAQAANEARQRELNAQREEAARRAAFGVRGATVEGNLNLAGYANREKGAVLGAMSGNAAQVAQAQGQAVGAAAAGIAGAAKAAGSIYGDATRDDGTMPKKKKPDEETY